MFIVVLALPHLNLSSLIERCCQSDSGVHVQESLHSMLTPWSLLGLLAGGPTSSEEVVGRFVPGAGEGECSFECSRQFRAPTVGTAHPREISYCVTSFQPSIKMVGFLCHDGPLY